MQLFTKTQTSSFPKKIDWLSFKNPNPPVQTRTHLQYFLLFLNDYFLVSLNSFTPPPSVRIKLAIANQGLLVEASTHKWERCCVDPPLWNRGHV